VRLFEHSDFEQPVIRAADHFRNRGLPPKTIQKNYNVSRDMKRETAALPVQSTRRPQQQMNSPKLLTMWRRVA